MIAVPRPLAEITADGELHLHFHRGQAKAWRSEKRFVFVVAGTQSGKTSFGPHWLHREIVNQGPGDYLAVTATFPLMKLKMLPEFLRLFDDTLHLGKWNGQDHVFAFHDGKTRVIFGSATHPNSLESATAKGAWLDECGQDEFRQGSWEAVQRRLALNEGRVLGTTTPYNLGWLKGQVFDRFKRGEDDYDVIQFESIENPVFPMAEYERARAVLPTWKFQMFYRGRFERPAGLIYQDFIDTYREEGGHLVKPFAIPPEWPAHGGLDFGAVNTARLIARVDPVTNVIYIVSESLEGGKSTPEHVEAAKAVTQAMNVRTWHGGSKSETQQRMDWARAGIRVQEPPISDVESGIDHVVGILRTFRLYVFDTCTGLRDEFGTYQRVLDQDGEPTEKIKDKETFHRLDSLRYLLLGIVARVPGGVVTVPRYGSRWVGRETTKTISIHVDDDVESPTAPRTTRAMITPARSRWRR